MMQVSLTYSDLTRLIKLSIYAALAIASVIVIVIVFFNWSEPQVTPIKLLIQSASTAIWIVLILVYAFSKLNWTQPWLAKLLGRRILHGLWWGELHTEYRSNDSTKAMEPIKIAFVIKQTYFFLSIQSYTERQPAHSTLERLVVEPKSDRAELKYVFEMQRLQHGENKITTGYGDLRLTSGDLQLKGFYWTNSPTSGKIELKLIKRDCNGIDSYADALLASGAH